MDAALEAAGEFEVIAPLDVLSISQDEHRCIFQVTRPMLLVEGTRQNLKKIAEYGERSLMLVTALAPVIGYETNRSYTTIFSDPQLRCTAPV